MELEKKHYYLIAVIVIMGLIAYRINAKALQERRDREARATIHAVPNPLASQHQPDLKSTGAPTSPTAPATVTNSLNVPSATGTPQ